jgi:ABC-2 type transport system permease protein
MKVLQIFWKSLKEQIRDWKTLSISLIIGPFFVLLYWLIIPSGSTAYGVMVINHDLGPSGAEVIELLEQLAYPSGDPLLDVEHVHDRDQAEQYLQDRDSEVLLIIPESFSDTLDAALLGQPEISVDVTFVGDLTNPYYAVGAVMAGSVLDEYVQAYTESVRPIGIEEIALGASAGRSEFDLYVPGMLIISIVMLVFIAAMSITYEVEAGTIRRLQLTRMTTWHFLTGISLSVILLGVIALLLTLLVAWSLGFESQGSLWVVLFIGAITVIPVVGVGLLVAAYSKTVSQAFIIANFPLLFFMFFTGAIYPIPRVELFRIGTTIVSLYDVLPPTHAIIALNKILTLGAGFKDVVYEMGSLILLSLFYYAIGIWIFRRRQMRTT